MSDSTAISGNIIDKRKLFAYLTAVNKLKRNDILLAAEEDLICERAAYVLEVET